MSPDPATPPIDSDSKPAAVTGSAARPAADSESSPSSALGAETDQAASAMDAGAEFEPAAARAIWGMRVSALISALAFSSASTLAILILLGDRALWAKALLLGLILLLALRLGWRYAAARFARFRFRLDGRGLEIHRGVFWHSEIRVLRSRVQHTDLSHGPLERRLGLASLLIHTAGSDNATLRLAGLSEARAREIRDSLLEGHDDRL